MLAQMRSWPDPGAQQVSRRMDRPARQDDLATAEFLQLAADHRVDPNTALPVEVQPDDLGVGENRQLAAHPGARIQIADRCRPPPFVSIGDGYREISVLPFRILIQDELPACLL